MKVLIISLVLLTSCRIQFAPKPDASIIAEIESASQHTDELYSTILNSRDKSFNTYSTNYSYIQAEINSIQLKNIVRSHGEKMVQLTDLVKSHFEIYLALHKNSGSLNDGQARSFQGEMAAFWKSLLVAESTLK